jgi:hypothetical protein
MFQLVGACEVECHTRENPKQDLVEVSRCEAVEFLASFHDDPVVTHAVDFDVRSSAVLGVLERRQRRCRSVNQSRAILHLTSDRGEGELC